MDNGIVRYTDTSGIPDLREEISLKLNKCNRIRCDKDSIVVSTGAKQAIVNSLFALTNPNDEVLIPSPYWLSYPEMCKLTDCKPVQKKNYLVLVIGQSKIMYILYLMKFTKDYHMIKNL